MSKFDYSKITEQLKSSMAKDERRQKQFGTATALSSMEQLEKDYIVLPPWFRESFGILGIPFGKWIQISGRPDAGKTSLSLLSIKSAQAQGYYVIYVETEDKTSKQDLESAGVDPDGLLVIRTAIAEEMFDGVNRGLDVIIDNDPSAKILLVIDSYGNTTSLRDSEIDQTEKTSMVGGSAKSNRLGLGAIRARQTRNDIAVLIVNYSYANIGSVGETNAGGRALEFFCSLIINASRKAWYERTIGGVKVRAGADVLWKTQKNHFAKSLVDEQGNQILLPKEVVLRISEKGFEKIK